MITVALIDDHPIVLDGLRAVLEEIPDISVIGAASSADEALRVIAQERPDVAILDLELPDRNGLRVLSELRDLPERPRVIVFSAYAGAARVTEALECGADSYILKGTPIAELVHAIHTVASGTPYVPASISAELVSGLRESGRERLTQREREILRLMARGLANKEIAAELRISERTVKFHVSEILARLGVANRAHAVAVAQDLGLV